MAVRPGDKRTRSGPAGARRLDPTRKLPDPPTTTVLDDIARQVEEHPHHPALDDGATTLTYEELWARAGTLATHLAARGVTTGTPVLVWGPRSTAHATALLGVLRAGAVAVPLSTMLPDERCTTMAREARATHAVTIGSIPEWAGRLNTLEVDQHAEPAALVHPTATPAPPGDHAYVFFTSGTTGTPKAVLGRHASLTGLAHWYRSAFAISTADRVSMVTNVAFVVTLRNLFAPLTAGATVCIAPDVLLPEEGLAWVERAAISVLHTTPTTAQTWLGHAPMGGPRPILRWTLFGGEPLEDATVAAWRDATGGSRRVANVYGSTELGASRAWFEVPTEPVPGRQPIGGPIPGTQLLVVADGNRLCDPGETGELVVRARDLPSGYVNDPAETARCYTSNPFSRNPEDRVYRTGDLATYLPDGSVALAGRTDDRMKIGGIRVDLAEVASVLSSHRSVTAAHVLPVTSKGAASLAAFVLVAEHTDRPGLSAELRRLCAAQLPIQAMPGRFVFVDRLPMTATGKVDRRALEALAADEPHADPRPDPRAPLRPPPRRSVLEDIARHVAQRPDAPAVHEGDAHLTYADLWARAGHVAAALAGAGVQTGAPVLIHGIRSTGFVVAMLGTLRAGAVMTPCASMLPPARCEAMRVASGSRHILAVGDPPTWAPVDEVIGLTLDGHLLGDLPAVEPPPPGRHAHLFFTSGSTGTPKGVLGPHDALAFYFEWYREAFGVSPTDRVSMATSTAFDVTLRNVFGPLTAGAAICIAPDDLLPEDGLRWLREAEVTIAHLTPTMAASWLAEAPEECARRGTRRLRCTMFAGEPLTGSLVARWRDANPGRVVNLYGQTETTMPRAWLDVPDDIGPGLVPVGNAVPGTQLLVLDEHDALCAVEKTGEVVIRSRVGATRYAFENEGRTAFVVNPATGDPDDIVYRTGDTGHYLPDGRVMVTGRIDDQLKIDGVRIEPAEVTAALVTHPSVRHAHTLALRGDVKASIVGVVVLRQDQDPTNVVAELRRHCGALLPAAAIPTRFVLRDEMPTTSTGKVDRRRLLAEIAAGLEPDPTTTAPDAPALVHAPAIDVAAIVELWRAVLRRDDITPTTNFFDVGGSSVGAVRLAHRLRDRWGVRLSLHDLLAAQTPLELATRLGATTPEAPAAVDPPSGALPALHRVIARHAATAPTAGAIDDGATAWSYATLERGVRAVAHHLRAAGVSPGALVAIHAKRTASLIPLLLGIHRAGAGYVPIDPDLPSARISFLIGDCSPAVAITDRPLPSAVGDVTTVRVEELERAMTDADDAIPDVVIADDPERVAYVIYTSGSTGNPKGVLVTQRALTAFVDAANDRYRIRADDRLLQYHSLSFDTSVEEIFCTLGAGATLVMPSGPLLGSAGWFVEQVEELRISVLDLPTSFWMGLVDDLDDADLDLPPAVRLVIVGGSAAKADAVARWCRRVGDRVVLCNAYGPTEVTIAATVAVLVGASYAPGELVTIGPPLRGVQTLVLDPDNREVADGEPGELLLGGDQLAIGYLNRPELTAEKFVVDPTGRTTDRYYRTGDRVRRTPDGAFVFEARVDDQVKIRGYRFELGEIEAAFATHPSVREAVAMLEQTDQDARIIVHVVLREGHDPSVDELRAHAATLLPSYAMPALIERRTSIPRTPGGKPDRRALRAGTRGPLGFAQEQQWFLHRLDPQSPAYNLTTALRLRGRLDRAALDHALNALLERHEALRTRYVEHDDAPVQVVDEPTVIRVPTERVEPRAGETPIDAARRALAGLGAEPFDLERDLLFRPVVIELTEDDHVVALRSHHIAIDGWSIDILVDELLELYAARLEGRSPDLVNDMAPPRELAAAERAREAGGSLDASIERYVARFTPLPAPLPLPLDRPRPSVRDPLGRTVRRSCGPEAARALRELARELRTTPFAVGLALFGEFLAGWCGTDDVVVGTPSADRDTPGSERTVGMLVNTLPLRLRAHGRESIRAAAADASRIARDAIADKDAPFDRIVRALRPPRVPGVHPLYQVTFQIGAPPAERPPVAGLIVEPFLSGQNRAKFDCSADLIVGEELTCRLVFATDVFDDATADACADRFAAFVTAALRDPDRAVDEVLGTAGVAPAPVGSAPVAAAATHAALAEPAPANVVAPSVSPLADRVAIIMGRLLGRPVGPADDFFGAGGHSLLAVKLCSTIERELGVRLGIATVFEAPSARALAATITGDAVADVAVATPLRDTAPPVAVPEHALSIVLHAFGEVLGRPVSPDDDFFASGGHSLLAVKLCSRIERESGVRLAVASVFDLPTARGLAALVAGVPVPATPIELAPTPAPAPPVLPAPDAMAAAEPRPTRPGAPTRPNRLWLRRAPLSFAQRRLWALEQLDRAGSAYLLTSAYDLYGALDVAALEAAVRATAVRHEILRTRYILDDEDRPEQVVDAAPRVEVTVLDLRAETPTSTEIDDRLRTVAKQPFDLAREHPWRAIVARVDDGHWVLVLTVHHIATDGESQATILRDLVAAYDAEVAARRGEPAPAVRPAPALQYADHAVWQHARHASGAMQPSLDHWLGVLTPVPEPLLLPTTRPRPARITGSGDNVKVSIGRERRVALDAFARAHRTTPFAVMLTAYEILLHRLTGRDDIVVGIPVTERTMDDDADTVGFFVNTLPVRVAITPDASAQQVLVATHRAVIDAIGHADAPFDLLVDHLALPRDAAISPLVQTMFSMQTAGEGGPRFDGLLASRRRLGAGNSAKFDLSLIASMGDEIELWLEYRDDVFDRPSVEQWGNQYLHVLDALLAEPARDVAALPLVDDVTRRWLVEGCNRTRTGYPRDRRVPELFAEIAEAHGSRVAVVDGARTRTYDELRREAETLAEQLRATGVRAGDRVALEMGRSLELVVAMLATLECGAAYVPVDPTYPAPRREMMHELARASAIVDLDEHGALRVHGRDTGERPTDVGAATPSATDPAYVMFTSGSTGTPKGVVVPHRGIVRLVRDTDYVRYGDDLVIAHLSNTSFDAATFEIWGALLNGARLVVLDRDTVTSPVAFAEAIRHHGITTMFVTTALFNVMAREVPGAFATVRDLMFGGEAGDPHAVRAVLADRPPARLIDVYGPTESTTFASWHLIEHLPASATSVPIGRPIANTTLHVVDAQGRPVPPLVEGELLIGGDGLALGYLDDPALTAARFVPDPFSSDPDARLYRTGDIVRRRHDGVIEFVGRRDHQVKIRGFRIELGDIEAALGAIDGIDAAHVLVRHGDGDDAAVHAYVVPSNGVALDGTAVRDILRASQPPYLVPDAVIVLDALPINPNGKVDRDALPVPDRAPAEPSARRAAPSDALEEALTAVWVDVLGRDDFGAEDNFFELGGNSIRAVRAFAAIERTTGVRLGLSALFEAPTVRSLATLVRAARQTDLDDAAVADEALFVTLRAGNAARHLPLYCIHPAGGQVFAYAKLLPALAEDQPVIGIREHGWSDPSHRLPTLEDYAARYASALRAHQPLGPVVLAGYSLGGLLAYEMARLLRASGREVAAVLLLDAAPLVDDPAPAPSTVEPTGSKLRRRLRRDGVRGVLGGVRRVLHRRWLRIWTWPAEARRDRRALRRATRRGVEPDPLLLGRLSERAGLALRRHYRPEPYDGRVVFFRATGTDPDFPIRDDSPRWRAFVEDFTVVDTPGNHANEGSMMTEPHVHVLAAHVAETLASLEKDVR